MESYIPGVNMVNVGFIGAGQRATGAHYPAIAGLKDATIAAVCDLDEGRLKAAGERFGIERRYTDYHRMLSEADLDLIYVIMPPQGLAPIVIDCLDAGKHVAMEKPPGMNAADTEAMIAAAERNRRWGMVAFQYRFTPIVEEVRRMVLERGPITMCLGEFHQNYLDQPEPEWGISVLLENTVHVVDFVSYMCGGEAVEIHALQDRFFTQWTSSKSCHNGLVRFNTGAVGIISGNKSGGARYLRMEVHGRGISAYLRVPEVAEIWRDNQPEPLILRGADLVGADDKTLYEGSLATDRHFVECVRTGREPRTSLQRVVNTMRLVDALEGD